MPPTFLLFIGLMLYIAIMAISLALCIPMLLIKSKKILAKKIIFTVAISFPCLIVVGIAIAIIFLLPALLYFWIANNNYIPRTPGIILAIVGLLTFVTIIAVCSLYLWYFVSNILYKRLDQKPVSEFLNKDKIYIYLKPFLNKFKIINS
ncbi:MAG: hypothetical protein JWP37_2038 [Mucilaginibacter sp.]|nr:hypothetical protein [Mucilaginibacter sp.]